MAQCLTSTSCPINFINRYQVGYAVLNAASIGALIWCATTINTFLFSILHVLCTMSFFLLQGSDPGYVDFASAAAQVESRVSDDGDAFAIDIGDGSAMVGLLSPTAGRLKCSRCQQEAPERSHHCKICDRCVHKFDHHCRIIGTCIGERNHCRFWWAICLHVLILLRLSISLWPLEGEAVLILKTIFGFLLLLLCLMLGMHTVLVVSNQTTYESAKNVIDVNFTAIYNERACNLEKIPCVGKYMHNIFNFCCVQDMLTQLFCCHGCWLEQIIQTSATARQDKAPMLQGCFYIICKYFNIRVRYMSWQPIIWQPSQYRDASELGISDDVCSNQYYTCC